MSMRIFIAADGNPNPFGLQGSRIWHVNLYCPLRDLGNELISFDYDLHPHIINGDVANPIHAQFIEEQRPLLEAALLEQVTAAHRKQPIDVFFSYFWGQMCRPQVIREIRSLGIVTLNWYCNAADNFELIRELAPAYDHCLVAERFRMDDYRRAGANPIHVPEAANPEFYQPKPFAEEFDATFVGQRYADRPLILRRLFDKGIDVRAWGPGWFKESGHEESAANRPWLRRAVGRAKVREIARRYLPSRLVVRVLGDPTQADDLYPWLCGKSLSDDEMVAMYSRSRISLGLSTCALKADDGERIVQVRLRDVEAPMCGAFYLVEYQDELAEMFEIDKEIVCYHDVDDLIDKCRFYLQRKTLRDKIRVAGRRRALADHTWQRRFTDVFRNIGLHGA